VIRFVALLISDLALSSDIPFHTPSVGCLRPCLRRKQRRWKTSQRARGVWGALIAQHSACPRRG
jgi:hypothetical protein